MDVWVQWARVGWSPFGEPDKGEAKGQLTPGDPEMELGDSENHEDGDSEVRDGIQGGRERETERQMLREMESEIEIQEQRKQMQGDREKGMRRQRPRTMQTRGHTT